MNKFFHFSLLVILICFTNNSISAQCPGCVIDLPPLGEDTIYLSDIPDGEAGQLYSEDMSFRLPKTTTPVNAQDPDTPAGLTISEITITSLVNLPPGINWTASQTVFETAEETDGCIRLCGTPLVADTFEVEVNITAIVFGFPQNTSFKVDMVIQPAVSSTEGFTMTDNIGCGSSTVTFSNNIASNGADGFSYQWNFGNGMTSTEENPAAVTYDEPGVYIVSYEAVVDTAAYYLTSVTVEDVACDDIFGNAPDMSILVNNPDGSELFDSGTFENTWPPISQTGFYEMVDGEYYMEVVDDDLSGDDVCGIISFNKFSNGTITVGALTVTISIAHLTTTVSSTDTVIIYEQPADPIITGSIVEFNFCQGGSMVLSSSYSDNNQWYQDGLPITGATADTLWVNQAGFYAVEYVSPDGCTATSIASEVSVTPAPAEPAYVNDNNLLTLFDESILPAQYLLQWYQAGSLLEGENGLSYCINAFDEYTLELTDLETGCSNSFSLTVPYNADADCTTSAEEPWNAIGIKLFPNPTSGLMNLSMEIVRMGLVKLQIQDVNGKVIYASQEMAGIGSYQKQIDITGVAAGLYVLQLKIGEEQWQEKVMVY